MARTKRASIHYVNNAEFSSAVVDYVKTVMEAKTSESVLPIVPDYIAECFLKIAEVYPTNLTSFAIPIVKRWLWMLLRIVYVQLRTTI